LYDQRPVMEHIIITCWYQHVSGKHRYILCEIHAEDQQLYLDFYYTLYCESWKFMPEIFALLCTECTLGSNT
jgi:hypothetical protein